MGEMTSLTSELSKAFPGAIVEVVDFRDETTLVIGAAEAVDILRNLKEEHGFDYLVDITSAHWPDENRIDVLWLVRNMKTRVQLRLQAPLPVSDPSIGSVTDLWPAANWLEREVYDLMGVVFLGHPDLRRIMLPEDFEGFPLRKEYPMEGYAEWRNYLPAEGDDE